jgi:cytochrome P450
MFAISFILIPLALLIFSRLVLNWRKLHNIPGPFLAGLSNFWRAFYMYEGKLRGKLLDLHQQYGSMVRYGVNNVSISDPEVISTIYSSRAKFSTADSYGTLVGVSNGKEVYSLISCPESVHGALRRAVAGAFTPTAVLDYEKYIDETIPEFLYELETRKTFDFADMSRFYSMDAASRFAFSEPLGCLSTASDVGGMLGKVQERFLHWGQWSSLPHLERWIYRNPITIKIPRTTSTMATLAISKYKARLQELNSSNNTVKKNDLLGRYLEASKQNPETLDTTGIVGMLMSTISGAGDTTASTIGSAFYYLLKNPYALQKLRDELKAANVPLVPSFAQTKDLRYLDAVVKEAMRLMPIINLPLERLVPPGGITISGVFFPEGSTVGVLPSVIHRHKGVFGEDVEAFRPERWTEASPEKLKAMEASFMGFSRGKRVCLGQHIAVLSLKKAIPALATKFDVSSERVLDC